jgi:hypothetical protein
MNAILAEAIRKILTADGDGRLLMTEETYDFFLIHSLVSYARAKREAENITKWLALGSRNRTEKDNPSVFREILKQHIPTLEWAQIDVLYETIQRDFRTWLPLVRRTYRAGMHVVNAAQPVRTLGRCMSEEISGTVLGYEIRHRQRSLPGSTNPNVILVSKFLEPRNLNFWVGIPLLVAQMEDRGINRLIRQ